MSELYVYPSDSPRTMQRFTPMTGTLRVAFGCQARVGKDTAVSYLREIYPRNKHISFAGPLYDVQNYAQKRCGFPQEKDRRFLQWVGTEWARRQDPDVWVRLAQDEIRTTPEDTSIFISDLRFPNEMRMLQEEGFKTVRIIRDTVPVTEALTEQAGLHASEVALADVPLRDWDYVIYNDGSVDDLRFKLKQMAVALESLPVDQEEEQKSLPPVLAAGDEELLENWRRRNNP